MTSTSFSEAPHPTEPRSPRLERTQRYRGVCSGLARTTGTDVGLWHVMFIVLAFFNGIGLLLYMLGVVLIPERGHATSLGQRLVQGPDRRLDGPDVLILIVLGLSAAALTNDGDGFTFLVVAAFGLLFFSNGSSFAVRFGSGKDDHGLPSEQVHVPEAPAPPLVQPYEPVHPVPVDPAPRHRSALAALTMGTALLVAGFMVLLNTAASAEIRPEVIIASALAVVGLGIVMSAWWGRSLLLVPVAIVLGLALAATSVARPALDAGVGDRTWLPGTGAASYRLGVGEATLDLRQLSARESGTQSITARVDVGHLIVLLPADLRVAVHAEAQLGDLLILQSDKNGHNVSRDVDLGPEGRPQVRLDLSVRTGQVEVRNV